MEKIKKYPLARLNKAQKEKAVATIKTNEQGRLGGYRWNQRKNYIATIARKRPCIKKDVIITRIWKVIAENVVVLNGRIEPQKVK